MRETSLDDLIAGLNDGQREAVVAPGEPLLVLAGAGSGKTRVLVLRVAHKIEIEDIDPDRVMCVTFTKDAAREMVSRLQATVGKRQVPDWIGTFHALSLRLLREQPGIAGLDDKFEILDDKDAAAIVTAILGDRGLIKPRRRKDRQSLSVEQQERIAAFADGVRTPEGGKTADTVKQVIKLVERIKSFYDRSSGTIYTPYNCLPLLRAMADEQRIDEAVIEEVASIAAAYQDRLREENAADFSDLLLWPTLAMREREKLRRRWARRFSSILADEVQDTSSLQFQWLYQLALDHEDITIVGDDDQTLYTWRLAEVDNILKFRELFPKARIIKLEMNYRCTPAIVAAADTLIKRNTERMGKSLIAAKTAHPGERIVIAAVWDAEEEAEFIVGQIAAGIACGRAPEQLAIIYRLNRQSRAFEEALIRRGIAYEVRGVLGFWGRAEVKDVLAWCRLAVNRSDFDSFARVSDLPPRGIGDKTLDAIEDVCAERGADADVFAIAEELRERKEIPAKGAAAIAALGTAIDNVMSAGTASAAEAIRRLVDDTGYRSFWEEGHNRVEAQERLSNVDELTATAEMFDTIPAFLEHADRMIAGHDGNLKAEGITRVPLMSGHKSKGLEFDEIYLPGWENGIFPSKRSIEENRLQEERRLAYVKLTRGKERVTITYRRQGRIAPSLFLDEMPEGVIHRIELRRPKQGIEASPRARRFADRLAREFGVPVPDGDGRAVSEFIDSFAPRRDGWAPAPEFGPVDNAEGQHEDEAA